MSRPVSNVHVKSAKPLISPVELSREVPLSEKAAETVATARDEVCRIINGQDRRLVVVVGPCSIHDVWAAREYADYLNGERRRLGKQLMLLMRVYFEKPRTSVGWKGLINDPHLDGSYDMETGLRVGRGLLRDLAELGLPTASEVLDPISPQYLAELLSWAAIGARTIESQTHREMASGLSMPVGFKNGTDGSLQLALDAMQSARTPHSFLGIDQDGATSIIRTTGNSVGHIVLRGGRSRPNYDAESIRETETRLTQAGLPAVLMVDCSHANSAKQHARQEEVWRSVIEQRTAGSRSLIGVM